MLNRRELLQKGATVAAGTLALGRVPIAWGETPPLAGMNVVLFISDQERAIQHFPRGWSRRHLPGFTRLQRNGLTFENAFCATAMCSPTRATMFTGYFPAQHGVKYTLEEDMPDDEFPQVELSQHFKNIGTVMAAAGYNVVYKGKWHLSKPAHKHWRQSDLEKYGFNRWSPPDAGANQDIDQEGGGKTDNDGNYMNQEGSAAAGKEGVLQYLNTVAAQQQPFFLIVSLVNPHDVLLVYSNPQLWSKPQSSQVMVSHVDLVPTLASLVNAPASARAKRQGVDYSDHILQRMASPTQGYVVFTYDDFQVGSQARRTSSHRSTSSARASGTGRSPSTTTPTERSRASRRCTT